MVDPPVKIEATHRQLKGGKRGIYDAPSDPVCGGSGHTFVSWDWSRSAREESGGERVPWDNEREEVK